VIKLIVKNDCLAFKTQIFCISLTTFKEEQQTHSGSKNEAFSTRRLCEWQRRETVINRQCNAFLVA